MPNRVLSNSFFTVSKIEGTVFSVIDVQPGLFFEFWNIAMSKVNFKIILAGDDREDAAKLILESIGGIRMDRKAKIEIRGEHQRERKLKREATPHSVELLDKIRKLTAQAPSAIFVVTIYTGGNVLVRKHRL